MPVKSKEKAAQALAAALLEFLDCMTQPEPYAQEPETKLYSFEDLAQMFGKSKGTIRQWVCAGEFGDPVKVGSSTRVTQDGVGKYITDHSGPIKKQEIRNRTPKVAALRKQGFGI